MDKERQFSYEIGRYWSGLPFNWVYEQAYRTWTQTRIHLSEDGGVARIYNNHSHVNSAMTAVFPSFSNPFLYFILAEVASKVNELWPSSSNVSGISSRI